jgi:hypothetical protein
MRNSWQCSPASDSCRTMRLSVYHEPRMPSHTVTHGGTPVQRQKPHSDARSAARRRLRSCRQSNVLCQGTSAAQWQCAATGRKHQPQPRSSNGVVAASPAATRAPVPVPKSTDEAIILLERLQRVQLPFAIAMGPFLACCDPTCSDIAAGCAVSCQLAMCVWY